jgi:predicted enzyme related to lactoylglutathione lyase
MTGPVGFWGVDDIEKTLAVLLEAGGTLAQPVRDVGGGMLIATVTDADGNPVGLKQG